MSNNKISDKLRSTISGLEKTFGLGSVMVLGDKPKVDIEVFSTGSIALDAALGIGGYPRGRIIEIIGQESSGKTTNTLHAIADCQKKGGVAAFIDAEHAFDVAYASALGIDVDALIISQPSCGEEALEVADKLIASGEVDMLVVDSVAAMIPRAELDGEFGDSKVGLHARLMSQAMRKLTGHIHRTNTCVIFINQLREKVGVVYGSPWVATGGNALKFYSSIRVEISRSQQQKDKDGISTGNLTKAKIIKNKLAPPYRTAEFDIMFGQGISKVGEIVDLGVALGLVDKSGSWYSYGGAKIGQGRDNAKQFFLDNPEAADEVEKLIREKLK